MALCHDVQGISYTIWDIFIICLYIQYYMPIPNVSLPVVIKSKAICRLHTANMFLSYILQKKIILTKLVYFSRIYWYTNFQDPILVY
jgi:hypothetical protein